MTSSALAAGAGRYRQLLLYALLSAAYVATGRLGLLLATAPGYATAFFLPAGLATAAMWIRGRQSLPWIFLGSLLLNLWVGHDSSGGLSTAAVIGAAAIASASTLQAALAGAAMRRAVGYPAPLDEVWQLVRFLLLAPVCCVVSPSLSLLLLWPLGLISAHDLPGNWLTWWVGDTRGVLVGLPLIFVLIGEPRALWRSRAATVALPMLLFFLLFTLIFIRLSTWETGQQLSEFRLLSQQATDRIEAKLQEQELVVEQVGRELGGSAPVSRDVFRIGVERILDRFPMVQAIEWAPRVTAPQRPAFEAAQRAELPDFTIHDISSTGSRETLGHRDELFPVTYVEPRQGNEPAVGLDLMSAADRDAAIERARTTGRVSATVAIHLVQESGHQAGLLLLGYVRGGGNGPGLVAEVLRLGAFINAVLSPKGGPLSLRLVDVAQRQALYDDFASDAEAPLFRQDFEFGQRRYELQTAPTMSYLAGHTRWESLALLSAGVYSTALLGALLLLGTGYAHRVGIQVEERTRTLAEVNQRLEREIEEREHAEAALRHAHRLEAVGQLTGGIAHDFNNLLTVVSANAELLRSTAGTDVTRRRANAILRASARGARLTRQLLAFSRRQALRPETVDLRQRTVEIAEMLSRSLQENIAIKLDLPDQLWPVSVDLGEFELAILNVAVNARDAMPNGGEFRLHAENLSLAAGTSATDGLVGDFVAVHLSDTGAGMEPDVATRAFEPYFTTKEVGAGSGLGLSQVYGFAKQSGGDAILESESGRGTTVTLYLPRAVASAEAVETASPRAATG